MRNAARQDENFLVTNWFMSVFESEFCKESWSDLTQNWTYEDFLELSNNVMYFQERKQAMEIDHERTVEEERHRQSLMQKM